MAFYKRLNHLPTNILYYMKWCDFCFGKVTTTFLSYAKRMGNKQQPPAYKHTQKSIN